MSVLGADLTIQGDVKGKANVELSGTVEGSIDLSATLIVLKSGTITGDVQAHNVIVQGTIKGDVVAKEKIELRDACQVTGNLQAASIAIAEGAFFQGTVKMQGSSTSKGAEATTFTEKRLEA